MTGELGERHLTVEWKGQQGQWDPALAAATTCECRLCCHIFLSLPSFLFTRDNLEISMSICLQEEASILANSLDPEPS